MAQMIELVAAVKAHALANYNKGGWDYIVECWDDKAIAIEIAGCRKPAGAIRKMAKVANIMGERRAEVYAEAW